MATKIKWNTADFQWNDNPYLWNLAEIADPLKEIIIDDGKVHPERLEKLDKKKKKKLVRVIMHMNGIKIYDESKEVKNIKHHIQDIELLAEELKKHVQIIH